MCGIAGFWSAGSSGDEVARARVTAMGSAIAHRGPDGADAWTDSDRGVALAHRRLAIVDLSEAGRQPMVSAGGRYVIVFNGEIYNHLELRRELGSLPWRGHSDTETLLAGIEHWGLRATLERAVGMFALALWDRAEGRLSLARDRLGEKPIYYGRQRGCLLFASELKALKAHPDFDAGIDRSAVALLLRHNYIPAPYTIHAGIAKLLPAHIAHFDSPSDEPHLEPYWSLRDAIERGRHAPFRGGETEAVAELERHLDQAIAGQRVADVPLGAFLSGGVDSSTIVALMQRQSSSPVRTFTIGFHEPGFDEADHARAVARHLGTDHTELYVTGRDALDIVPKLPTMYCEPFADSSQIPTFLVSQLARRHVTVALSGDAGDELFCGYTRYERAPMLWRRVSRLPRPLRSMAAAAIRGVPVGGWDRLGQRLWPLLGRGPLPDRIGDRAHKLAEMLQVSGFEAFYRNLMSHQTQPEQWVLGAREPATLLNSAAEWPAVDSVRERMMALDSGSYLPDDILTKVDRAAMAVSLETRVPLLDHRVVEFAWSLPMDWKVRNGVGKWLLRQVLYRHVPRALIDRPKTGFGVPLGDWLRGPLRGWAEALLEPTRLRQQGLLDTPRVRAMWDDQLAGRREWMYPLWDILMLQAWLDT